MIGLDRDRVLVRVEGKSEGCHSGLFSQALHFAAFGDWSGACCRRGGAARVSGALFNFLSVLKEPAGSGNESANRTRKEKKNRIPH